MPTFTKSKTFSTNESPIASADLNSIGNDVATFLNTTKLDADNIQDGAITNAKLAGSISGSKLSSTTPGYVLLGTTTTGVPTFTALSGDVTVTGAGVTAIGANKVTNSMLGDGVVDTAELADGAVETAKIEDLNVTTGKLAANAVTTAKITDANVTTAKIADSNVTTAKIADDNVTSAKLAAVRGRKHISDVIDNTAVTLPTSSTEILNTGTISPATGKLDVDGCLEAGNTTVAHIAIITVQESVNGGAYATVGSITANLLIGSRSHAKFGFTRDVTSGTTYAYKVLLQAEQANGSYYKSIGSFIKWSQIA